MVHQRVIGFLGICLLGSPLSTTDGMAQDVSAYSQLSRAQAEKRDVSFQTPSSIEPGEFGTSTTLTVKESINTLNEIELRHRSYNGGLVGPTIRVNPGQSLKIKLQNRLRPVPINHGSSEAHDLNATNLHTHGLHVSPKSPADNVFIDLKAGQDFDYGFSIPADHPAGTFWYHAHRHGSTSVQLASGMAGALIVNGGLDDLPSIRAMKEKIMVLQQFAYREVAGEPAFVDPEVLMGDDHVPVEAINGVVTPTIVMRPGEIQRWRIIHAGTSELIDLDIEGINFYEIAVDGLATGKSILRNRLRLFPGYRFDVLVKAPERKTVRLMSSRIADPSISIRQKISARKILLRLVVAGEPVAMSYPTDDELKSCEAFSQADVPTDAEVAHRKREIIFNVNEDQTEFAINGDEFDPNQPMNGIQLGTCEEWVLKSENGVHPFHIHVNPFASRLLGSTDEWVWRDTIVVEKRKSVVIRSRFLDFDGKTVFHCHNLIHEDKGMMKAIEIENGNNANQVNLPRESAPRWSAISMDGKSQSSKDFSGPTLLVLHRGMNCIHCAEQLTLLSDCRSQLANKGIQIVAISPFLPVDQDSQKIMNDFGFPLLTDTKLKCFEQFKCLDHTGEPLHGLFLIDGDKNILFQEVSETANTNMETLVPKVIESLNPDTKGERNESDN